MLDVEVSEHNYNDILINDCYYCGKSITTSTGTSQSKSLDTVFEKETLTFHLDTNSTDIDELYTHIISIIVADSNHDIGLLAVNTREQYELIENTINERIIYSSWSSTDMTLFDIILNGGKKLIIITDSNFINLNGNTNYITILAEPIDDEPYYLPSINKFNLNVALEATHNFNYDPNKIVCCNNIFGSENLNGYLVITNTTSTISTTTISTANFQENELTYNDDYYGLTILNTLTNITNFNFTGIISGQTTNISASSLGLCIYDATQIIDESGSMIKLPLIQNQQANITILSETSQKNRNNIILPGACFIDDEFVNQYRIDYNNSTVLTFAGSPKTLTISMRFPAISTQTTINNSFDEIVNLSSNITITSDTTHTYLNPV